MGTEKDWQHLALYFKVNLGWQDRIMGRRFTGCVDWGINITGWLEPSDDGSQKEIATPGSFRSLDRYLGQGDQPCIRTAPRLLIPQSRSKS